ncbi:hypothetical protein F383_18811 [Gossypium arboreum]|uniref:Uncharacterized protein n=1 Tax=Gossypium arboreum TaxID=29729 RepID=A0A0B0NQX1_GOSAR|nr:hypothetical protein F383_18811 [Gossypium arboreum]
MMPMPCPRHGLTWYHMSLPKPYPRYGLIRELIH